MKMAPVLLRGHLFTPPECCRDLRARQHQHATIYVVLEYLPEAPAGTIGPGRFREGRKSWGHVAGDGSS